MGKHHNNNARFQNYIEKRIIKFKHFRKKIAFEARTDSRLKIFIDYYYCIFESYRRLMYLCVGTVVAILYSDIIIIPEVQDFIVKILGGQAGVEWERRVQHEANDANMEAALAKNRA